MTEHAMSIARFLSDPNRCTDILAPTSSPTTLLNPIEGGDEGSSSADGLWYIGVSLAFLSTFTTAFGNYFVKKGFIATDLLHEEESTVDDASSDAAEYGEDEEQQDFVSESETMKPSSSSSSSNTGTPTNHQTAMRSANTVKANGNNEETTFKIKKQRKLMKIKSRKHYRSNRERWKDRLNIWINNAFVYRYVIFGNILIAAVTPIVDIISFGFAAQSIIIPLGGVTLLWNFLLAVCYLGEEYNNYDIVGNVVILVGAVLMTATGQHESPDYQLPELIDLYARAAFLIYFSFVFVMAIAMIYIGYFTPDDYPHTKAKMICVASLPGFIGGNQIFVKSMAEMVKLAIADGVTYFECWQPYVISISGILIALMQIILFNKALHRYDALVIIPIYTSVLIFIGVLSGMCYFREWNDFEAYNYVLFTFGLIFVICGILLVSRRKLLKVLLDEEEDGHLRKEGSSLKKDGSSSSNLNDVVPDNINGVASEVTGTLADDFELVAV